MCLIAEVRNLASGDTNCSTGGIKLIIGNQSAYVCNGGSSTQTDDENSFSGTGTIKGTISLSKETKSLTKNYRKVTSAQGGLWLTPEKVQAVINQDKEKQKDNASKPIPTPIIEPVQIEIQSDNSYEVPNVPVGEYSLVYVDPTDDTGVKIDEIIVKSNSETTKDITETKSNGKVTLKIASLNGENITNATVRVNELNIELVTDDDGVATIEKLPEGIYSITVSKENYVSKYQTFNVTSGNITDLETIELNTQKGKLVGKVEANVVDDLANIIVFAKASDGSIFTTLTNSSGNYTFNALPVGQGYSIIAKANDFKTGKVDNVEIQLSQTSSANTITLQKSAITKGNIAGYARFADVKESLNHAGIIVSVEGTDYEAITSRDGSFILNGLDEGTYTLNFTDSNHNTQTKSVNVIVGATVVLDDISLLAKVGNVTGKVVDENNTAVVNAIAQIQTSTQTLSTVTNEEGIFTINGVISGLHTVSISKDGYGVGSSLVTISEGETTALENNIVITRKLLSGQVYLGDDISDHSGVNVLALGTASPASITDTNGKFTLYGLAKGTYKLLFTKTGYVSKSVDIEKTTTDSFTISELISINKEAGVISGTINIPASFGSSENLKLEIVDRNGNVVSSSTVSGNGEYFITNVSSYSGYILRLVGTDSLGNQINSQVIENINVNAGQTTSLETALTVSLADPNPPVITTVKYDTTIKTDEFDRLVINPSIYKVDSQNNKILETPSYINFEVIASDADSDAITYTYEVDNGQIISQNKNQMKWLAPDVGGTVSTIFTAKSNSRDVSKTLEVKVNHFPTIELKSHNESELKDDENILTITSIDVLSMSVAVNDLEDGDLSGDKIKWYSNKQGLIGTGLNLSTTLKAGKHTITIEATDSSSLKKVSKNYYVQVNTPEQIVLKVAGKSIDLNQKPLNSTYSLDVNVDGLTLEYSSSDTTVATVSSEGAISALKTGVTIVTIKSTQKNSDETPIYETQLVVKVIDEANASSETTMGLNEIYQIRVDKSTKEYPLVFENLPKGNYLVKIFDKVNIVDDSVVYAQVTTNEAKVTDYGNFTLHNFEVSTLTNDYEVRLKPYSSTHDSIVKVALYPGVNVRDTNDYINKTYWDNTFEPNDAIYLAKDITLQDRYTSTLDIDDAYDYYSFDVIDGQKYTVEFYNESESYDNLTISVGSDTTSGLLLENKSIGEGNSGIYEFTASYSGKAYLHIRPYYSSHNFKYFKYNFAVLPSVKNGLKQSSSDYEPNNSKSNAYEIDLSKKITSSIESGLYDWYDYFSFDIENGKEYTFELKNHSTSAGSLYVYLGDENNLESIVTRKAIGTNSAGIYQFKATYTGKAYIYVIPTSASYYSKYHSYNFVVWPSVSDGLEHDSVSYEPNNSAYTAYPIELNKSYDSDIIQDTQEWYDVYSLDIQEGENYTLEFYNDNISANTLYYNAGSIDNRNSVVNNVNVGVNTKGISTFTATYTGKLYITVGVYSSSYYDEYFKYNLKVISSKYETFVQDSDTYEPNNSYLTPYKVNISNSLSSSISASTDDIRDYYSFDVVEGKNYTLELFNKNSSYGTLYVDLGTDADLSSVFNQYSVGKNSIGIWTFTADKSQTLKLNIRPTSSSYYDEKYDYTFKILPETKDGLKQNSDTYEPNNSKFEAYKIDINTSINSSISSNTDEIRDYYSFDVVEGKNYTVELYNKNTSYTTLYVDLGNDSDLSSVFDQYTVGKNSVGIWSFTATKSQTLKLNIRPSSYNYYDENFDYTLKVLSEVADGLTQDVQTYEPNNTAYQAYKVAINKTIESEISSSTDEIRDYYTLSVEEGKEYTLELFNKNTSYSTLYADLYFDSENYIVTSGEVKSNNLGVWTFTAQKTADVKLYLRPYYTSTDKKFEYKFTLYNTSKDDFAQDTQTYEPNNSSFLAYEVSLNTKIESEITASTEDRRDFYSFDVIEGKEYTLEFFNEDSSYSNLYIYLGSDDDYDWIIEETKVASNDLTSISFTAAFTGKAKLFIQPSSYHYANKFDYWFRVLPTPSDGLVQSEVTFEPNSSYNSAYSVDLGTEIKSKLSSDNSDRVDIYSVEVEKGKTYNLILQNDSAIDQYFYLEDKFGTNRYSYGYIYDGTNKNLDFTAIESGKVYLRIYYSSSSNYSRESEYTFLFTEK